MSDWIKFWDSAHSIYVNAHHKDVHYRDVATGIAGYVEGAHTRVLDYGSGEATHADIVAAAAQSLVLCDAAPTTRAAMQQRFAGNPNIAVRAPEEIEALPDGSFDLIVANSVVQYLSSDDLDRLLRLWRRLLSSSGKLIVADVIPPDSGTLSDVRALLVYAARNGFLLAAIVGLARTALSPYRKLRATLGIASYDEPAFRRRLEAAGFTAERLAANLEHNPARMSFLARRY